MSSVRARNVATSVIARRPARMASALPADALAITTGLAANGARNASDHHGADAVGEQGVGAEQQAAEHGDQGVGAQDGVVVAAVDPQRRRLDLGPQDRVLGVRAGVERGVERRRVGGAEGEQRVGLERPRHDPVEGRQRRGRGEGGLQQSSRRRGSAAGSDGRGRVAVPAACEGDRDQHRRRRCRATTGPISSPTVAAVASTTPATAMPVAGASAGRSMPASASTRAAERR